MKPPAGLALTLFGGVRRFADDLNRVAVRGDPHMFIVGTRKQRNNVGIIPFV